MKPTMVSEVSAKQPGPLHPFHVLHAIGTVILVPRLLHPDGDIGQLVVLADFIRQSEGDGVTGSDIVVIRV
ncbi:hypothetical protein [Corynebacterium variabile]|uniref:hypothetical protein n=1 Tax=Corynebacterium variabile TaxID=1727 RepID=UPI00289D7C05|nr:hypothetical protein [Corynebacterium variabile]